MSSAADAIFNKILLGNCPGGVCNYIQQYSEAIVIALVVELLVFLATLLPFVFSWGNRKRDGKKRILFAVLACLTFYFWLAVLVFNSVYCFGFLAHRGPCRGGPNNNNSQSEVAASMTASSETSSSLMGAELDYESLPDPQALSASSWLRTKNCSDPPITEHQDDLENLTVVNILIIVVLVVVLIANANEGEETYTSNNGQSWEYYSK